MTMDVGTGQFVFRDERGDPDRPVKVWYNRPEGAMSDLPLVFVLHGMGRDADRYRDAWVGHSERSRFLLLVPEFSKAQFPGAERYNLGSVFSEDEIVVEERLWTFSVMEHLFDFVKTWMAHPAERYFIYGHSAGSQFVHRLVFFKPRARFEAAVAANAGAYLMPTFETPFPSGLGGSGLTLDDVRQAFKRRLIVLLGTADNDPEHPGLNRSPDAMKQGRNRFERGQMFYRAAKAEAERLGVSLAWELETVPGVGHNNAGMAPAAVAALFNRR